MMNPEFRKRVLAGEFLTGVWCNLGAANSVEIASRAGFDWILLDTEHGPGGDPLLVHQMQAMSAGPAVPIVRISTPEPIHINKALDLGATGIMAPRIRTLEEVDRVVASGRYPPAGIRGVSRTNRATGFGLEAEVYMRTANESVVTIIQVENLEILSAVDRVAARDGVDVLFIGPMDLSTSLGIPGQTGHPRFREARESVLKACRRHGKAAGILTGEPEAAEEAAKMGFTFLALGSDGGLVAGGMRRNLSALKSAGAAAGKK